MGALIQYPTQYHPRTAEIPDPRGCATCLFDELCRATGLSDDEVAEHVRQAVHDPMVDGYLIEEWRKGETRPPLDYAFAVMWLAGRAALDVVASALYFT